MESVICTSLGSGKKPRCALAPISLLWVCSLLILLVAYCSPSCFGIGKQEPLSLIRERGGQSMQTKAVRNITLTKDNQVLLSRITATGKKRNWQQVQKLFSTYSGDDIPILSAVMHISVKCQSYQFGRMVYERICSRKLEKNGPVFAAAMKIYARLGKCERVRKIWAEAQRSCAIDAPLASSRIDAAAVEGDLESALDVLDLLNNTGIEIDILHITSAIRACHGAKGKRHEAATPTAGTGSETAAEYCDFHKLGWMLC